MRGASRRFWTRGRFNGALFVELKARKSEAISVLDFLGIAVGFRDDGCDVIASLTHSKEKVEKLVGLVEWLNAQGTASLAAPQKLAGKLFFRQTAVMGRFGRSALKPIYGLVAKGGGACPQGVGNRLRWWEPVLPTVAPRSVVASALEGNSAPIRIFSRDRRRRASLSKFHPRR